jgi:CRISPR-associated endonuclease Csn1
VVSYLLYRIIYRNKKVKEEFELVKQNNNLKKQKESYSIGLDIGVASVGWTCLTSDFRIQKHNGRYAMGVREFESAETAEARRVQRGTRRRYNRRIKRIQLLQQTIGPLFEHDPGYFIEFTEREKHFWRNSNQFENNSLSETLSYLGMDIDKYPTIYHLRNELLHKDEEFHPRLIYLALHNLVKYRGHFLNENMNWTDSEDAESLQILLPDFFEGLINHGYELKEIDDAGYNHIISLLHDTHLTNADKRKSILDVTGKSFREPISLIIGLKASISKLFSESDQSDIYKEENLKISFTDKDITETIDKLTDDDRLLVEKANVIYQSILLNNLLGDAHCVSEAKVKDYDLFGKDLKLLKEVYNGYFGEKAYRDMFITTKENQRIYNEARDVKVLCEFDKFIRVKSKHEDSFYKNLKKKLDELQKKDPTTKDEQNIVEQVRSSVESQQFLIKPKNQDNSAIPHQNNVYEAERILRNQQKFHPEITDRIIKQIKEVISFRIPYYIGPLVKENDDAKFGWVSRKQEKRHVKPWNFHEVIDRSQSAENFISNMTSDCAYLMSEKVLPKHSLTYEKFELLNELNGIQIRSSRDLPHKKFRLSKEEKTWLIDNVFSKRKTVTHRALKEGLKNSPFKHLIIDENSDGLKNIYGTQKEDQFGASLSTLIDMQKVFGPFTDIDFNMLEEIIYWITVFEEKDIIAIKVKEKYPDINKQQIRKLLNLNYTGWGRLSRRLVDELPADQVDHLTILEIMQNEPKVFMEVMSIEKYNLTERIADINLRSNNSFANIKYQDIAELHGSPALKKGIWQAILIIEELVDIFGEPENIMIEFAREEGVKARTNKRKNHLKDMEKAVANDEKELKQFLKEHLGYKDEEYQDNRLFLYITQQGKCLYSGETLNISRLQDYEVDHILPRSFVKDNSLDNLALVKKNMNQKKGYQKMPLEVLDNQQKIKQKLFWKKLHESKLISPRKYNRLLKESFSDQDKEGFFARQLVETRQITKHVKDLLDERFENTDVHTVNANVITQLREHSNVLKMRNTNNKHHAVDAALTAIVIQFIINQYGTNFLNFNFKYQEARKKWKEMLSKCGKNFFLFSDIDKYNMFTHFQTGELLTGREFLSVLNDEMPWQTTKKIGSNEASFYDQTLYSPKETKGKNPQYTSGKLLQGVHSSMSRDSSYLISYKYIDAGNREKVESKIVDLFVIEKYQTKKITESELALFLAEKEAKGRVGAAKIHTRILKHQLITVNNHPLYFVSAGEMNNAKQFRPYLPVMNKLYKTMSKSESSVGFLREVFRKLSQNAINQYSTYLPGSRIKAIENYIEKVIDLESFNKGVQELLKMASASAARSDIFGGRYERRLKPADAKFVHQSITGLKYRKPKSYRNELWSR